MRCDIASIVPCTLSSSGGDDHCRLGQGSRQSPQLAERSRGPGQHTVVGQCLFSIVITNQGNVCFDGIRLLSWVRRHVLTSMDLYRALQDLRSLITLDLMDEYKEVLAKVLEGSGCEAMLEDKATS